MSYTNYFSFLSAYSLLLLSPISPATFRRVLYPQNLYPITTQINPMLVSFLILLSPNKFLFPPSAVSFSVHCNVHWIHHWCPSVPWLRRVSQSNIISMFRIWKRVGFTGPVDEHAAQVKAWCGRWSHCPYSRKLLYIGWSRSSSRSAINALCLLHDSNTTWRRS